MKSFTVILVLIATIFLWQSSSVFAMEPICPGGTSPDPNVIFCDDFESNTPLTGQGRYFEYDNNGGDFIVVNGVGLNGSKGMRALWQKGEIDAGNIKLAFGRNPSSVMNKGIRPTENFREIYYRLFIKMQKGWQGNPFKLSRATVIADSNWSQAMIAHIWQGTGSLLAMDPVRCVDNNNNVKCIGYNDFAHMDWLGIKDGITPIFDSSNSDRWVCIEAHAKLNDPGQSNGIQEFWINGNLETSSKNLDFVKSYTSYAINAIFIENYWNTGSPQQQERYIDNIVVSTQRIGCVLSNIAAPPSPPSGLTAK